MLLYNMDAPWGVFVVPIGTMTTKLHDSDADHKEETTILVLGAVHLHLHLHLCSVRCHQNGLYRNIWMF